MPPKSTTAAKGTPAKKSTAPAKTASKPAAKSTSKAAAPAAKAAAPAAKAAAKPEKKEDPPAPKPIVWKEIGVKELDKVVVNDNDGTIKASGKWATVVDDNGIPARFLRHRDVNMLSVPNPGDMDPETIRKALIGAIKYGKPFILDMMESEMYEYCRDQFDKLLPGLLDMVLDKSIIDENYKYMQIVKEEDGPDFKNQYDYKMLNFSVIVLSQVPPNEELLRKTFPVKIV